MATNTPDTTTSTSSTSRTSTSGSSPSSATKDAAKTTEKAAEKTASTAKDGAEDAANAAQKTVEKTASAVKDGAKETAKAAEKTASTAKAGAEDTAKATGKAVKSAQETVTEKASEAASAAKESAPTTSTTTKSTAKKTTAKKPAAKKSTAKKSTAKKSTAKKSTAKKSTAKKSTATRSTTAKQAASASTPAKKSTAKKSTAKKTTAKKTTARRPSAKKATTTSTAKKTSTTTRPAAKRTTTRPAAAKKATQRSTTSATRTAKRTASALKSGAERAARTAEARATEAIEAVDPRSRAIPAAQVPPIMGEAAPQPADEHTHEAIEHILAARRGDGRVDPRFLGGRLFKKAGREWVRRYHRLEIQGQLPKLDRPTLFVANHGFGGITDLNAWATWVVEQELKLDRPLVALGHGMAWKIGGGEFFEGIGGVPASATAAQEAFDDGCHVIVMPGGDVEGYKPFKDRDKVIFGGRSGFARLAIKADVPIFPIVTAGAGETLLVLSRGEKLAKITGMEKLLRMKAFPITVSIPWGLNIGTVGLSTPYIGLPAKMTTRVLPLMKHEEEESSDHYATRIHRAMQDAMDDMTKNRKFLIG